MPIDELAHLAYELYAHVPAEFVAARNAQAARLRQEGRRELASQVRALPKASVAAWAVGAVVRHQPGELDELGELGAELRVAQAMANPAELRALSRRRRERARSATEAAVRLAEEHEVAVSAAAQEQIAVIWQAVVIEPDAERAVRSGLLVRGLEPGQDAAGALAVPGVLAGDAAQRAGTSREQAGEADAAPGTGGAGDAAGAGDEDGGGAAAGAGAAAGGEAGDEVGRDEVARGPDRAAEAGPGRGRPSAAQAREIRRLRRAVRSAERGLALAGQELEAATAEHARLEAEGLHLAARLDELQRELAEVEERAETVEEARAGAQEEVEDATERCRQAEEELSDLRGRLADLED